MTNSIRLSGRTGVHEDTADFRLRVLTTGSAEIVALAALIRTIREGRDEGIPLCLAVVGLLLLPWLAERLLSCRLRTGLFVAVSIYALGPVFGHVYRLYYTLRGYDKLLHITGGVVFAILGVFLAQRLNRGKEAELLLCAVFGLCLGISVAAVWEFGEFAMDRLFGMDAQNDTLVTTVNSYLLGAEPGLLGSTGRIESVVVNGVELEGYIDIGLIDTMHDMMLESLGSLVYVSVYFLQNGKRPLMIPRPRAFKL